MPDLTLQEMEEILYRHEMAELSNDLDATMATVVDNPHYEFPSWAWAVDGSVGVREHYRRALADLDRGDPASKMRVHGVGPNTLFREAFFSFNRENGERVTGQYVAVIEFDPVERKVKGERQYGDSLFAEYLAPHCGPDYGEIPGVTRLNSNTKPITREDMFASTTPGSLPRWAEAAQAAQGA